ncbi:hypothetical protein GCM10023215_23210 [Pseudonocardia yuanmonensis]|uniref:Uncharacterized protein n=1 Tax=Pseudonocardia yuanmonensis TaxID=1095914 RepID=A0ABP8WF55_9PSEU
MNAKVTDGYGTCPVCARLKHVTPESTLRLHNRFSARGTVVSAQRCAGSGAPSVESGARSAASA